MSAFIVSALLLVCSFPVFAGELQVTLDMPSSYALYNALHVKEAQRKHGVVVKRLVLTQGKQGDGHALGIGCYRNPKDYYCKVALQWPRQFQSGQVLTMPQWMAEAITSSIQMNRRADLGEWWKGFESSDGRFGVLCEQVYTPSDLPFWTHCQVRLVRMPWDAQ